MAKEDILIKLPVILTSVNRRKDRSVTLKFETSKEIDSGDFARMDSLMIDDPEGWLVFKANQIQDSEIPQENAESESKTPSQRLRASLFVWFENQSEFTDFDLFYRAKMEQLINFVKSKLPER